MDDVDYLASLIRDRMVGCGPRDVCAALLVVLAEEAAKLPPEQRRLVSLDTSEVAGRLSAGARHGRR